MYFSLVWLPNTLFLSFCLRPLIRLCLALSHLCYSYCKLCLALSHLCYSYCKHAIRCIICPRNSLENIVNFGILIPQVLLFNIKMDAAVHTFSLESSPTSSLTLTTEAVSEMIFSMIGIVKFSPGNKEYIFSHKMVEHVLINTLNGAQF